MQCILDPMKDDHVSDPTTYERRTGESLKCLNMIVCFLVDHNKLLPLYRPSFSWISMINIVYFNMKRNINTLAHAVLIFKHNQAMRDHTMS